MTRRLPAPGQDIALLLARLVTGVVLIAHGWQKLVTNGVAGTTDGFEGMGVAAATVATVTKWRRERTLPAAARAAPPSSVPAPGAEYIMPNPPGPTPSTSRAKTGIN